MADNDALDILFAKIEKTHDSINEIKGDQKVYLTRSERTERDVIDMQKKINDPRIGLGSILAKLGWHGKAIVMIFTAIVGFAIFAIRMGVTG